MKSQCPYCQVELVPTGETCASCGKAMPWVADVQALRDEIKSREVNRGRATYALVEEVFGALRGGKPVSVATLKGFAFAWLFPRTMIVLGSIVGVVLLGLQTWILFNQTKLMEGQTTAARAEQDEKLESRIARRRQIAASLRRAQLGTHLFQRVSAKCDSDCSRPVQDVSIPTPLDAMPVPLLFAMGPLNSRDAIRKNHYILMESLKMLKVTRAGAEGPDSQSAWLTELVASAALQCAADPQSVATMAAALQGLDVIEAAYSGELPSDPAPTVAALALGFGMMNVQNQAQAFARQNLADYSLGEFTSDIGTMGKVLAEGFSRLEGQCEESMARDVASLRLIREIK